MKRMTRRKDKYECRIGECRAEEWMEEVTGVTSYNWTYPTPCDECPFMKYVNHLAEMEDVAETLEDDRK